MAGVAQPQAAQTQSFPLSAVACLVYSFVTVALIVLAVFMGHLPERSYIQDPDEVWHARTALLLIFSACLSEVCLLSVCWGDSKKVGNGLSSELNLHNVGDSILTISQYFIKTATAMYLHSFEGGIMHTDPQAWGPGGGDRRVYVARYAQWSVAVPLFILVGNRSFLGGIPTSKMVARCAPGMLASFSFCWAAWLAQLTPIFFLRWALFGAALLGASFVVLDQLMLVAAHCQDEQFGLKFSVVLYQASAMFVYGAVYTFGRFGMISSRSEQLFFAYGDSSICIVQGALLSAIRHKESLFHMQRLWRDAATAKEDLDNVIRKACVPVFTLDLRGQIVAWNKSLQALTGLDINDVGGKRLVDISSPESAPVLQEAIAKALASSVAGPPCAAKAGEAGKAATSAEGPPSASKAGEADKACPAVGIHTEILLPTKVPGREGEADSKAPHRHLIMSLVVQTARDGRITGIVGIGQDISELSELKSVQLKKSALLAMMSHEIRSPLHGILGLTESMLNSEKFQKNRQLTMVKGCAARLLDLVTNIMELAQHEKRRAEGRKEARPQEPVDFGAIAHEVTTMSKMAVDKANKPLVKPTVELINKCADKALPLVPGCPHKCTQLLYNLVTNACKFTAKGSVTITAEFKKDAQLLEVSVTDTGKGITPEGQKRIFQPFEQESHQDTKTFQGIGLGLAVCSEICELLGGDLRVKSEFGVGSTFTVSVPCDGSMGIGVDLSETKAKTHDVLPPMSAKTPSMDTLKPFDTMKSPQERALVLSVDDDEANQEVVRTALAGFCDVHCVGEGREALRFLDDRKERGLAMPGALLVDYFMPGMDGFEFLQELSKRFETVNMPVFMLSSSNPSLKASLSAYTSASTDFVQKPFRPEVLKSKVRSVLAIQEGFAGAGIAWAVDAATQKVRAIEDNKEALDKESARLQQEVSELRQKLAYFEACAETEKDRAQADELEEQAQELCVTRAVFTAMLSRLEVVNKVAQGGQHLLDVVLGASMVDDSPEEADWKYVCHAQQQVAHVVAQHLQMLENLTERPAHWPPVAQQPLGIVGGF